MSFFYVFCSSPLGRQQDGFWEILIERLIGARFSVLGQIFGQMFDQIFGQGIDQGFLEGEKT